jgi:hypothetical protein
MSTRVALSSFELANPIYVGCTLTAWKADTNGIKTGVKATIYEATTGSATLTNPQILDSEGKLESPVYVAEPVILEVSGLHVPSHDTGLISPPGTWRGDWATATIYWPGDIVQNGANGDNNKDVYIVVNLHVSGVWATDKIDLTKLAKVIDYVTLTNTVVPDATTAVKGKAALTDVPTLRAGSDAAKAATAVAVASLWKKGADIASAATLAKPADANLGGYHVITGSVGISAFWTGEAVGAEFEFRFSGVPLITHSANFILPTGANVTAAAGDVCRLRVEQSSPAIVRVVSAPPSWYTVASGALPVGHAYGMDLSNNVADTANDIDISAGKWRDPTDTQDIVLAAALTKRLDAAWAVGNNQGGLDTGSKAVSTWYHLWAIKRTDTGVVDVLFSTSATAPTMPSGYTIKQCLGSVKTDASGNILAFVQRGSGRSREFHWLVPSPDRDDVAPGTSAVLRALPGIPLGRRVKALLNAGGSVSASGNAFIGIVSDPATNSPVPIAVAAASLGSAAGGNFSSAQVGGNWLWSALECWTDTSQQVRVQISASAASTRAAIVTSGWREAL